MAEQACESTSAGVSGTTSSPDVSKATPSTQKLEVGVTKTPIGHSLLLSREKPAITKPVTSDLLNRLEGFLPQMKQANEHLSSKTKEERAELQIEASDSEGQVVEMEVALVPAEEAEAIANLEASVAAQQETHAGASSPPVVTGTVTTDDVVISNSVKSTSNVENKKPRIEEMD